MIEAQHLIGGELHAKYKCQFGNHLLIEPIQTYEGSTACEQCYLDAKGKSTICPMEKTYKQKFFKDKARKREIMDLELCCSNSNYGCSWQGKVKDLLTTHIKKCLFVPKKCETCREQIIPQHETNHFEDCTMNSHGENCLFEDVGCKQKDLNNQNDVTEHINNSVNYHMYLMMTQIMSLVKSNEELVSTVKSKDQVIDELQKKTQNLETTLKNQVNNDKTMVDDVDLRLQLHENSTYNGELIWKIDNYRQRKSDAEVGRITALHSAPCFTSQYGYKFCLRAYLNGDGLGKNTHLSLFLVIMKSEYDNILEWPFQKKVRFTLLNQSNRANDLTEVMIPDKNSSSFQKPKKEMNIASGCPLFVEIDRLERDGFYSDDSIFVKVQIE